jgi:ABC-type multidrug transport system permease subunit
MNVKRWLLASLAAFVVILVLDLILNMVLLAELYRQTAAVWRPMPDLERLMPFIWVAMAASTLFFTLIYAQGFDRQRAGVAQGMRYGLYLGLFYMILYCAVSYVVLPLPGALVAWWFGGGLVEYVAAGAAVGWMYRHGDPA